MLQRDYNKEWEELYEAYPELVGKELADDIYRTYMQSDASILFVYESMIPQEVIK